RVRRLLEAPARDPGVAARVGLRVAARGEIGAVTGLEEEELALEALVATHAAREVDDPEVPDGPGAAEALLEVPGPGERGGGRLRIDLLGREGRAGDVAAQVAVAVERDLRREVLRRLAEEARGRVAPVAFADHHAHAVVEEDLAVGPDLLGQQLLERVEVLVADRHARGHAPRCRVVDARGERGVEGRALPLRGRARARRPHEPQRGAGREPDRPRRLAGEAREHASPRGGLLLRGAPPPEARARPRGRPAFRAGSLAAS